MFLFSFACLSSCSSSSLSSWLSTIVRRVAEFRFMNSMDTNCKKRENPTDSATDVTFIFSYCLLRPSHPSDVSPPGTSGFACYNYFSLCLVEHDIHSVTFAQPILGNTLRKPKIMLINAVTTVHEHLNTFQVSFFVVEDFENIFLKI